MAIKDMIIRLSIMATVTVSALSLFGYFDHVHMLFELSTHFKPQYLVISVLCFFSFLFCRMYAWLVICISCIAVNACFVIPWYLSPKDGSSSYTGDYLKIVLSNVHSENLDYSGILMLVEKEKPDIVILLEVTDECLKQVSELEKHFPFKISRPRQDNFGIALFSRIPWKKAEVIYLGKADLPSVVADIDVNGKKFRLIGTHPAPPINKNLFDLRNNHIEELSSFIEKQPVPVILAGDLNLTMWSSYYKKLIETTGLKNARKGFGLLPSWPTMLPAMMIPLDHFLFGPGFEVLDLRTAGSVGSDHLPVIAEFAVF